eukprot:gene16972-biopygen1669
MEDDIWVANAPVIQCSEDAWTGRQSPDALNSPRAATWFIVRFGTEISKDDELGIFTELCKKVAGKKKSVNRVEWREPRLGFRTVETGFREPRTEIDLDSLPIILAVSLWLRCGFVDPWWHCTVMEFQSENQALRDMCPPAPAPALSDGIDRVQSPSSRRRRTAGVGGARWRLASPPVSARGAPPTSRPLLSAELLRAQLLRAQLSALGMEGTCVGACVHAARVPPVCAHRAMRREQGVGQRKGSSPRVVETKEGSDLMLKRDVCGLHHGVV